MFRQMVIFFTGLLLVLGIGLSSSTAQAQGNNSWTAQYYNNTSLSGSPNVTATLTNLNLNWGNGAPANGIRADDWTARFNTVSYFNAGTYRFSINADDAFRLYVHGRLVIDTFNNPRPNQTFTTDVTMTSGDAGIQIDYREYIGDAFLYVSWQQTGVMTIPPTQPNNVPNVPTGTWSAQYFNNTNLSGYPNATGSLSNLNVSWGTNAPANGIGSDNWTARFNSSMYFNAGTYRFSINADDAFRLYVNNNLVLETFTNPRPNTVVTVDVAVPTGNIPLQVDYREYIGPAFVYLSWSQINSVPNTPAPQPQVPGQATATVNTGRLNLRSTPFIGDNVIKQLPNRASYPIIGRNATNDWYQIRDGQTTGWVAARYVIASNTANVPVVNTQVSAPSVPTQVTGWTLRASGNVNIRSNASVSSSRLSIMPQNATANIIARNSNNTWWLVNYNGVSGWVIGTYTVLPYNINYAQIPVL